MLPDRVSNPGPLTYESGALPIALRGPATYMGKRPDKDIRVFHLCLQILSHPCYEYLTRGRIKNHVYLMHR